MKSIAFDQKRIIIFPIDQSAYFLQYNQTIQIYFQKTHNLFKKKENIKKIKKTCLHVLIIQNKYYMFVSKTVRP